MQTHWKNIAGCLKENGLDLLPIRKDLRSYNVDKLRHDVFAGLSVALIVFPQAMAYALLAGLPIEYGLYGATIATVTACRAVTIRKHASAIKRDGKGRFITVRGI